VLVSATLNPKLLSLLGITSDFAFTEYPAVFPASRAPVYSLDTAKVAKGMSYEDKIKVVDQIDRILDSRHDRKGIIHTSSYQWRNFIVDTCRTRARFITHGKGDTAQVIKEFKSLDWPAVLVSPSVTTGYDFPGSQCEFQIIAKLPFPDRSSKILIEREKDDPWYSPYIMVQSLIQSCGRGMRSENDRCETFIIDNNIRWVKRAYKPLFTKQFRVQGLGTWLPDPPPSIAAERPSGVPF